MKTLATFFRKAPFPAVMTVLSLILFLGIYYFCTLGSSVPLYGEGLVFIIPFLCFGTITFLTGRGDMKPSFSSALTGILIVVLPVAMFFVLVFVSLDAATTTITDVGSYQRVLRHTGYPDNALIRHFPEEIPKNAKDPAFRYHPAVLQGGEDFELRFDTDPASLRQYAGEFSTKAKWIGKSSDPDAEQNGIVDGEFEIFPAGSLPENFTVYVFDSEPYRPNDWNHGKLSLAAVSGQKNQVLFYAQSW